MNGWLKSRTSNLWRNKASGKYYARVSVGGKDVWRALDTDVETIAKARLSGKLAQIRGRAGRLTGSNLTLGECAVLYLESKRQQNLKPRSLKYREQTISGSKKAGGIKKYWPDFDNQLAATVTREMCEKWDKQTRPNCSATWFNGMLQSLRGIFEEAISAGCCEKNPAKPIVTHKGQSPLKPARVLIKSKPVYSFEEMELLWQALAKKKGRRALIFCRFLYHFTLRVDSARHLTPAMVDRKNARFNVPGEWVKGEREGTIIHAPIFPEMFTILNELDERYGAARKRLLPIESALETLKRVCADINLPRLNHHSFRHIFTTHALLKGKPIPLVAKWLNHKDGGALLLKRYNHVLDEVSRSEAASLNFRNGADEKIHVLKSAMK